MHVFVGAMPSHYLIAAQRIESLLLGLRSSGLLKRCFLTRADNSHSVPAIYKYNNVISFYTFMVPTLTVGVISPQSNIGIL